MSLVRLELTPLAPEANTLSIELQGRRNDFTMRDNKARILSYLDR